MMNYFNNSSIFQLPQLFEQLQGTPQAEQLQISSPFEDLYKKKFWNDFRGTGLGQMSLGELQPTQFKADSQDIYNDFSSTYFL